MKKQITKFIGVILFTGFLLSSCDTGIIYPPVSEVPTGEHRPGQFVWHDLASPNPQSSMAFYKDIFGWEFETLGSSENSYYVIKNNGKPIGGIFKLAAKYGAVSEWVASISVEDVDAAVTINEAQGGKTIFKKAFFKGRGETAMVQDPQGAFIAFIHAEGGDPDFRTEFEENAWLWNELWTNDYDASMKYYEALCGFSGKSILGSKAPYYVLEKDGTKYFGLMGNPVEGARSSWMPYIRVADVDKTVEVAKKAGASFMMEPNEEIRKGSIAVLLDPLGAQFTIQVWPIK